MNTTLKVWSSWLLPGMGLQFTSCRRHVMDELTFGAANWSNRFARQKTHAIVPQFASSLVGEMEMSLLQSGQPDALPTPTDVPVPTPRDVPVPDPIDIPPPEPHDIPPPEPKDPVSDPRPRPIP